MFLEYFMNLFDVMIHRVSSINLSSILVSPKYIKNDAKVDKPNLAIGLKHAPKIFGCYLVRFSYSPTSIE